MKHFCLKYQIKGRGEKKEKVKTVCKGLVFQPARLFGGIVCLFIQRTGCLLG
jgi:hypothetical protein